MNLINIGLRFLGVFFLLSLPFTAKAEYEGIDLALSQGFTIDLVRSNCPNDCTKFGHFHRIEEGPKRYFLARAFDRSEAKAPTASEALSKLNALLDPYQETPIHSHSITPDRISRKKAENPEISRVFEKLFATQEEQVHLFGQELEKGRTVVLLGQGKLFLTLTWGHPDRLQELVSKGSTEISYETTDGALYKLDLNWDQSLEVKVIKTRQTFGRPSETLLVTGHHIIAVGRNFNEAFTTALHAFWRLLEQKSGPAVREITHIQPQKTLNKPTSLSPNEQLKKDQ